MPIGAPCPGVGRRSGGAFPAVEGPADFARVAAAMQRNIFASDWLITGVIRAEAIDQVGDWLDTLPARLDAG